MTGRFIPSKFTGKERDVSENHNARAQSEGGETLRSNTIWHSPQANRMVSPGFIAASVLSRWVDPTKRSMLSRRGALGQENLLASRFREC